MQFTRLLVVAASIAFLDDAARAQAVDAATPAAAVSAVGSDPAQWRALALSRALAAAETMVVPYRRAESLASIARIQASVAESAADRTIHGALAAAEQIREPAFRGWAMHDIVQAQIAADDLIGARQTASRIEAKRPHGAALAQIASVQVRGGDISAARRTAETIRDPGAQGEVLRQIVAIHAARGELIAAGELLRDIDDPFYRALAIGDMAVAEVRGQRSDRAHALAGRVRRADRSAVYGRIALARAEGGDGKGAIETLPKIHDTLHRAITQGRLAALRAGAGDTSAGSELFAAALATADSHPREPARKALTLAQLGHMQAVSGEPNAMQTLARALRDAQQLPVSEERAQALEQIARGQARAGDVAAALRTALLLDDRFARALLVRDAVTMHADLANSAMSVGGAGFDDPLIQAAARFGVLGTQLQRADPLAGATIEAARTAVRKIDEIQARPAALAALAGACVEIGDIDRAAALFAEALAAAAAIARDEQRAAAYVEVIGALNGRLLFLGQPARPR